MSAQHLSEVCGGDSLEEVSALLQRLTDRPDDNEEEKRSEEDSPYLHGIWGYKDADGRTAFHWAVALKNYALASQLLTEPHNAPVMTVDNDGVSPFMSACMVGAPEAFVKDLLELSVKQYPDFLSCQEAQKPSETTEVQGDSAAPSGTGTRHVDANEGGDEPNAEEAARVAIINMEDDIGNTPLLTTASRGNLDLVKFLLESGADYFHQNQRGQSALHRAVSKGDMDVVEFLVNFSEKANAGQKSRHRQWMNLQDSRGDSALFYASAENNEELGRYLLRHGADRDLKNKDGKEFWEL